MTPARTPVFLGAPQFVRTVTAAMLAGRGDELPVSALPVDGTYPAGTSKYEKRNISNLVAVWDPEPCIQCGNCAFVCPHSVIRSTFYPTACWTERRTDSSPRRWTRAACRTVPSPSRSTRRTAPGAACAWRPARCRCAERFRPTPGRARCGHPVYWNRAAPPRKAINLDPYDKDTVRRDVAFFETLPLADRSRVDFGTVRGAQFLQPLFEFSGACAGCGETPYLRLVSQLFGDRLMIANATGCSSIYAGNLPTTPWTDQPRRAWSGLVELAVRGRCEVRPGLRLGADQQLRGGPESAGRAGDVIGADLAAEMLDAPQPTSRNTTRSGSGWPS